MIFPTIANFEKKLLSGSVPDDLITVPFNQINDVKQYGFKELSKEQALKDISVFARAIINGYCGWPFHSRLTKFRILSKLAKIYDSVKSDITAKDLFNRFGSIMKLFPDNHIRIKFCENSIRSSEIPLRTVGKNISETFYFENKKGVAIIAIPLLPNLEKEEFKKLKNEAKNVLANSNSLIIDFRGNGGGSSRFTDWLAEELCGADTPYCKKSYIRTTEEGKIIHTGNFNKEWTNIEKKSDPAVWHDFTKNKLPKNWAYNKPIYILIDRKVASSAELFISKLLHHPNLKLIGDRTRGCEVYGYMGNIVLENSGILFYVGQVYRDMEKKNFEQNGYSPDIICVGQDAYIVALSEIAKNIKSVIKTNENNK